MNRATIYTRDGRAHEVVLENPILRDPGGLLVTVRRARRDEFIGFHLRRERPNTIYIRAADIVGFGRCGEEAA